jgi:hypothetical protein
MDSFEDHLYWRELRHIYQAGKHEPLPASGVYERRARERAQVLAQDPAARQAYDRRWAHLRLQGGAEHRSRSAAPAFPRLRRRQAMLAILTHQLEREQREC